MKKLIVGLVAGVALLLVGASTAAAVAAWTEPAKSYGGCVSKSTGYLRVLERNNLAKSVNGGCKSTERKVTFYSRSGVDALVKPLKGFEISLGGDTATCKPNGSNAAGLPRFACVKVTPAPSPTPTS
ncbi:hypothetical protein ACFFV7_50880 [Nonomuraea spiralis]|uniref:Uncharacterized protein n=1 Tax=Nonomuraea spiralis TaxID=46182 RepID=A0ABV5IYE3_9ACTN|nr:hypothetical protein [Nonomuraea spiralis]GGS88614.1 hypothetical protein GCM10010176_035500 [Nonomuraea spiralis]